MVTSSVNPAGIVLLEEDTKLNSLLKSINTPLFAPRKLVFCIILVIEISKNSCLSKPNSLGIAPDFTLYLLLPTSASIDFNRTGLFCKLSVLNSKALVKILLPFKT